MCEGEWEGVDDRDGAKFSLFVGGVLRSELSASTAVEVC